MRFIDFLNHRTPDEALLREYVYANSEWIGLEFKEAKGEPKFGLRKTVAAFANSVGGDLFLGVDRTHGLVGTPIDSAAVSRILNQEGAPLREDYLTDLVRTVQPPVRIPLSNSTVVLWLDVAAHGRLAAVLDDDGRLALYDRPGAESTELKGFDAIDLFRRKTRARLLFELYTEGKRIVDGMSAYYIGPNMITDDTIGPVRRILESAEWRLVATDSDKAPAGPAYLSKLLSAPADYASWEKLPFGQKEANVRMRKMVDLEQAVTRLRQYLVGERVISA